MAKPLKLFILAGEPSGDRIAAGLVRSLRRRGPLAVSGVGGFDLIAEGLNSLYPMTDLSVMGITDVVMRLPLLLWRIEQTARAILADPPDVVVLVDAQEFSALLAKRLKRAKPAFPVILYVSPSVWARSPHRAKKIKPLFAEVLAVLPFEPAAMLRLGGPPTSYVGHPSLGEMTGRETLGDGGMIALLPGSRGGELRRHLPLFKTTAETLGKRSDISGFFLPTLPGLKKTLEAEVSKWSVPVKIIADRQERQALYTETALAITCAGTATLELAMAGVPMVVTYVMDKVQARIFAQYGRPRVGLPNIILNSDVTPELILDQPIDAPIVETANRLLDAPAERQAQLDAFVRLRKLMDAGELGSPRADPAERVLSHLKSHQAQAEL